MLGCRNELPRELQRQQKFPHLRKRFWGRHFWARGYLAISFGAITDEMIRGYVDAHEGQQIVDDSRFPIDHPEPLDSKSRIVQWQKHSLLRFFAYD